MIVSKAVYRHYENNPGWYWVDERLHQERGPFGSRETAQAVGPLEFIQNIVASWSAMPQRLLA